MRPCRVPTAQGKHGKWTTKFPVNSANTQGIWFAQVINSLILKLQDIATFAAKLSNIFEVSFVYEIDVNFLNMHGEHFWLDLKNRKNAENL